MANQLQFSVDLVNDKVKFIGGLRGLAPISVDYIPPVGDGEGYTSLELFLMSFATCAETSVLTLLRRFGKNIETFRVSSVGVRRETHPTGFTNILLTFEIKSRDIKKADVEKAVLMSEENICPVWSMIKNNVEVETKIIIVEV